MRITTRGRYALRASLAMAKLAENGKPVSISCLSEEEDISAVFLEQIFFRLRKAGIVSSTRGPGGGFTFTRPLDKLTVKQLLEAVGENLDATFCDKQADCCDRLDDCLIHQIWLDMNDLIKRYFENITLASILDSSYKDIDL